MTEIHLLVLLPIMLTLLLLLLRREQTRYWWLAYLGVVVAVTGAVIAIGGLGGPVHELVGVLVIYLLPLALMFVALRADIFERRLYLIPLLGPIVYFLGVGLSLSVVVTLGLLEP